ncbi:MAG: hypothetical protein ACOYJE_06580 [Bacteroidaceae bacterium]|jgi:hypothetical protein
MKQFLTKLYIPGAVCALAGLVAYLPFREGAPYILITGGALMAIAQFFMPVQTKDPVIIRLYRQRVFSSLFLVVAGILMKYLPRGNEWILAVAIAAVIQLYTAFRIPVLERREAEEK